MARANLREQKTTRARGEFYILLVCVCVNALMTIFRANYPAGVPGTGCIGIE
jgi:hypothetical protein